MSEDQREQREHERNCVKLRAEVRLHCGVMVDGRAVDVSLGGLLFETERSLPLDCPVRVCLVFEGAGGERRFECQGRVARFDARGLAISFTELTGRCVEELGLLIHGLTRAYDNCHMDAREEALAGVYYTG